MRWCRNFAGQWLYLRTSTPSSRIRYLLRLRRSLRQAFQHETELFSRQHPARRPQRARSADRPTTRSSTSAWPSITGFRTSTARSSAASTLADPNRGGLLGQGSILTVTSYPNRTSVVQRGKWILENLLGTPPPPPPPDVPELKAQRQDGKQLTMREQMEEHRANPDLRVLPRPHGPDRVRAGELRRGRPVARPRTPARPIDATGKLPDGTEFEGPAGLRKLLLDQISRRFRAHRHRKTADLRAGPRPRALTTSRRSRDRPRRRRAIITACRR